MKPAAIKHSWRQNEHGALPRAARRVVLGALGLLAIAALAGCRHAHRVHEPAIPTVSSSGPVTGDQPPAPWVVQGVGKTGVLNFVVDATGADELSQAVAAEVGRRVVGELAKANMRQNAQMTDVRVSLDVEAELYNQRADFHIYRGDLDARVTRSSDRMVVGRTQIHAEGKFGQGPAEGRKNLAQKMSDEAAAWIAETATGEKLGLAAMDITIEHRFLAKVKADYVDSFVREVSGLDGVVSCAVVWQKPGEYVTFRVVYFAEKFPEGLLNAITLVKELNFKTK